MQEIEWQFDTVDLRPVIRWLEARQVPPADSAPATSGRPAQAPSGIGFSLLEPRDLFDTYLDTPDWRFFKAGLSVRLRTENGAHECSLKTLEASQDGLRRRTEIRTPLSSHDVAALLAADAQAGEWIRTLAGGRALVPLFCLRSARQPYAVLLGSRPVGEVVLDETAIDRPSEGQPSILKRVEIEVIPESIEGVRPFVDDLRAACRLTPAAATKYDAGLLALDLSPIGLPDVGPVAATASPSMGELAYAVLRRAFLAYLRSEPGARLGEDVEALHDMRVATRRMRAALTLFEPALPLRARRLRQELRWIAGVLGAVRDLDIQLEWIRGWPQAQRPGEQQAKARLTEALERRRVNARRRMLRALDSVRTENLVNRLSQMLRQGPPKRSRPARTPAVAVFPAIVERRQARLVRARKGLDTRSPPEAFHRLRIRCKRLRYAVESARDLYGAPASDYAEVLVELQDLLGAHQDAYVANARLEELLRSEARRLPLEAVFLMGRLSQRHQQRAVKLRKRLVRIFPPCKGKPWSRLVKAMHKALGPEGALAWPPPVAGTSPQAEPHEAR
jgi:CHAD domain-containing protein